MIEILLLSMLLKKIGRMLREKGRAPIGYQVLTALLWFGGEITGFVVGFTQEMGNGAYVLGLAGAAVGALVGYLLAASVKPLTNPPDAFGQVFD